MQAYMQARTQAMLMPKMLLAGGLNRIHSTWQTFGSDKRAQNSCY